MSVFWPLPLWQSEKQQIVVLAEAAESKLLPYCSSKTWRPLAVTSRNKKGTPALVRHSKYQYQIRSPQAFQQLYIEASWVQLQEGVIKSCSSAPTLSWQTTRRPNDICYYPSMSLMGTSLYMIYKPPPHQNTDFTIEVMQRWIMFINTSTLPVTNW